MELKDYYAIMGVKPTDDTKTIKTAYRRLAKNIILMSVKSRMLKSVLKKLLKHGKY